MGRHKNSTHELLDRFKGNSESWKTKHNKIEKDLKASERARSELKATVEELKEKLDKQKSENEVRDQDLVVKKLQDSEAANMRLQNELNEAKEQLLYEKELDLLTEQMKHLKQLDLLNAKKNGKATPAQSSEIKDMKSERRSLTKQLKSQEKSLSTAVPSLKEYSPDQSDFLQRNTVVRCEMFLKSGASTKEAYNHLLLNLVKKAQRDYGFLQLSPLQTLSLKSAINLSDGKMKLAKSYFKQNVGLDLLASRGAVSEVRKTLDVTSNYKFETVLKTKENSKGKIQEYKSGKCSILDLEKGITDRIQTLDVYSNLLDNDHVTLCLMGDKGSDETKICVAIENVKNPNSPHNLILLTSYEGQDDIEGLKANAADVLKQWDELKEVEYTGKDGVLVRKRIEKKIAGDMKILSALLGHTGQSCSTPCYICEENWTCHGSKSLLLENVDFQKPTTIRSCKSYARDSKTGANGVEKGSTLLCLVEPEDTVIPTIHTVQGIYDRYFDNHIGGQLSSMDREDDNTAKSLRNHKKNLTVFVKEEKKLKQRHDTLLRGKEDAFHAMTAYNLISRNHLSHLKLPESLCDSQWCIINHLPDRKTDEWIQCDDCQKYFHFPCSNIYHPDVKMATKSLKRWKCNSCKQMKYTDHQSATLAALNTLNVEVTCSFNELDALTKKRTDLDSLLFKSTGENRKKMEAFMSSIGCDPRTWYQSLCGNQVRTILREPHIDTIFEILDDTPQNRMVKKAMLGLAKLMSLSANKTYSDPEIDDIDVVLQEFLNDMKLAFPKETLQPKLHLLGYHLIPYLRKNHSWGRVSEQAIEHYHAQYNILKRYYVPIRNVEDRIRLIVRDFGMKNWFHDTGIWTN